MLRVRWRTWWMSLGNSCRTHTIARSSPATPCKIQMILSTSRLGTDLFLTSLKMPVSVRLKRSGRGTGTMWGGTFHMLMDVSSWPQSMHWSSWRSTNYLSSTTRLTSRKRSRSRLPRMKTIWRQRFMPMIMRSLSWSLMTATSRKWPSMDNIYLSDSLTLVMTAQQWSLRMRQPIKFDSFF